MSTKPFMSIEKQIEILRSRGLIIDDEIECKQFLSNNNYYRVSGYSLTLRKNDQFYEGVSVQNIIDIYYFDRELRNVLLKYLEIIEVRFKSIFSHDFSDMCGPIEYKNISHFTNEDEHSRILNGVTRRSSTHEPYLQHHIKLNKSVPFWAIIHSLTMGDVSKLYKICSEIPVKTSVALNFNVKSYSILEGFMFNMTTLRNMCAHGNRLYNRLFIHKPNIKKDDRKYLSVLPNGKLDYDHLFSFILIMKRLLPKQEFLMIMNEILELCSKYPFVNMKYYGFSEGWENFFN